MSAERKIGPIGCVLAIAAMPLLVALRGLVVRDLWNWFAVPLGAPSISILGAIGLGLLVALVVYHPTPDAFKDEEHPWLNRIIFSVLASLFTWGVGYFVAVVLA